jgi:hypothetical protein
MENKKQDKAFLSKSTFIRGLQCEKSLYLHKKRPFLRDRLSPEQLAKFSRGHKVGVFAQELVPGGVDLGARSPFQMAAAIKKTAAAIQSGAPVIYEASFQHLGVRVALDILHRTSRGWEGVEIKSSLKVSETFLWDASLQYFVITGSGLSLTDFSIAYMNPDYVRQGPLNIQELFIIHSVMDQVVKNQQEVAEKVERFREVASLPGSPPIEPGSHCTQPYPCDFIGHCWKNHPQIRPMRRSDSPDLPGRNAVSAFLKMVKGPTMYFSTLSFAPAIPMFAGTSPYRKLAFSAGWTRIDGDPLEPADPADATIIQACPGKPFPASGIREVLSLLAGAPSLLVYGKANEVEVLKNLCGQDQRLLQEVESLSEKMHDLQDLFRPWLATPWGRSLHDSPEDALSYLGAEVEPPAGGIAGRLQAALLYEKLSEGQSLSDEKKELEDLVRFHENCLKNLQNLYRVLEGDRC